MMTTLKLEVKARAIEDDGLFYPQTSCSWSPHQWVQYDWPCLYRHEALTFAKLRAKDILNRANHISTKGNMP